MIKKIYHLADIHIPLFKDMDRYRVILQQVIDDIKQRDTDLNFDEKVIFLGGDIVHQKITVSNEELETVSWFIRELNKICLVRIIAGNHDLLENNQDRLDTITPVIRILDLENVKYLDKELDYQSGCLIEDNIVWCLFSIFDKFERPEEIEKLREEHKDKTFIGLFHGALIGSSTDLGFTINHGQMVELFFNLDFVLCGDIHKRQELSYKDTKIVYPGSILQHSYGENVEGHGYLIWDVAAKEYEAVDITTDYGFYKFEVSTIDDVANDKEKLCNLN